jgi:hypothetical protein
MTKQYRVTVTDVNGKETIGSVAALTDLEVKQLRDICTKFRELTYLSVDTPRRTVYFNPKHVVSVLIEEIEEG